MRRVQVNQCLVMLANALGFYRADEPEMIAHDLAHSILLFGKAANDFDGHVSVRIENMSDYAANQHELKAIALQHAAMRRLGAAQALRTIVEGSMGCFRGTDRRTLLTVNGIMRAVKARPAAQRDIKRFVRTVDRFAYFLGA